MALLRNTHSNTAAGPARLDLTARRAVACRGRYDSTRVVRPPSPPTPGGPPRHLASNFDGLHSEGSVVGPQIIHSTVEHVGDDMFNVQNAIAVVLGSHGNAVVVADKSFGSTFPVAAGTALRFFEPSRAMWPASLVWQGRIVSSTRLAGAAAAPWTPLAANLSAAFAARYGWGFAGFLAGGFQLYAVELDASVPATLVNYTVFAQVNSSYAAKLIGNRFSDGLSRVGPLASPGSVAIGNVFNGTMLGGLLLSAEVTWLSGNLGIANVTVEDNLFVDCCSYSRAGYPHGQCDPARAAAARGLFPVYNPAGSRNVVLRNNTVL